MIMLHISFQEEDPKKLKHNVPTKFIVSEPLALDGTQLIPINIGSPFISTSVSMNELGKQLLKAAGDGNVEELKTLMTKGAPFTADWLGTTPLHLAAQNNHLEVCEILLRAGISRDARTKVDRTPLHMAACEGNLRIVQTLLLHGADYDCRDLLAMTPLHWAAQNGHADVAAELIRYGASTNVENKFDLTPAAIAHQIGRTDIVAIINAPPQDPSQHLALHLSTENSSDSHAELNIPNDTEDSFSTPVETIMLEDDESENSLDPEVLNGHDVTESSALDEICDSSTGITESLKLLQQHGITMLPNDDTNILSSVMESGRSVVLTDVGKEVLSSVKESEPKIPFLPPKPAQETFQNKRVITVTPEQFLAMTMNGALNQNIVKQLNGKTAINAKPAAKKIVMKKNKLSPIPHSTNVVKIPKLDSSGNDMETVMQQLIEARKLIQEYKIKLSKKEAEAEQYKQQLKLLLESK